MVRISLKRFLYLTFYFFLFPLIFLSYLENQTWKGESLFNTLGHLLSIFPGKFGSLCRAAFYHGTLDNCSWELSIGFGSFFAHRRAKVGKNVSIGAYCIIGSATIGDNVLIASRVSLLSGRHQHINENGIFNRNINNYEQIIISKDCWVGEGAIVMNDIGDGAIISAGSVVNKKAPSRCLAIGNPARFIEHSSH